MLDYLNSNIARIYNYTEAIFKKYDKYGVKYTYVKPKNEDDYSNCNIIGIKEENYKDVVKLIKDEFAKTFKDMLEVFIIEDEISIQFSDEFTNEEWLYSYKFCVIGKNYFDVDPSIMKVDLMDMLYLTLVGMDEKYELDYINLYLDCVKKDVNRLIKVIDEESTIDNINKRLFKFIDSTKEEYFSMSLF